MRQRTEYGQLETDEEHLVNGHRSDRQPFSVDLSQHDTHGLLALSDDDDLPVGTIYNKQEAKGGYLRKRAAGLTLIGAVCLLLVACGIAIGVAIGKSTGQKQTTSLKHTGTQEGKPAGSSKGHTAGHTNAAPASPAPSSPAPKPEPKAPEHHAVVVGPLEGVSPAPPVPYPLHPNVVYGPGLPGACPIKGTDIPAGYLSDTKFLDYWLFWRFPEDVFYPNTPDKLPPVNATAGITFFLAKESQCFYFHWGGRVEDIHSIYMRTIYKTTYNCICNDAQPHGCAYKTCKDAVQSAPDSDLKSVSFTQSDHTTPFKFTARKAWTFNITYSIRVTDFKTQYGMWQSQGFTASDSRGNVMAMLSTQLEPEGARLVMPCFDEPQYKGAFTVSVSLAPLNKDTLAQFTTPVTNGQRTSDPKELPNPYIDQVIDFVKTPPMSTYTFGVAVGPFQPLLKGIGGMVPANATVRGKYKVVTYAIKDREAMTELAAAVAWRALYHYRTYTGVDNGLQQYELVAIKDKQGAMESWGVLMFDETRFLFNPTVHGMHEATRTTNVVCHELAHQWFGNYVTTRTWADLVVNEGIASYLEYDCMQDVVPFMTGVVLRHTMINPSGAQLGVHEGPRAHVLAEDASPDAPAIVPSDREDAPAFNLQTYAKGAAFLEMVAMNMAAADPAHQTMVLNGRHLNPMQVALQTYLSNHPFGTATVEDLLRVLANQTALIANSTSRGRRLLAEATTEEAVNTYISYFRTWMDQPGYPVVTVESVTKLADSVQVTLIQERFCSFGLLSDKDELECPAGSWWIPLSTSMIIDPQDFHVDDVVQLTPTTDPKRVAVQVELKHVNAKLAWTLSKVAAYSPYRVAYPREHVSTLLKAIRKLDESAYCEKTGYCNVDAEKLDRRARIIQHAAAIIEDEIALGLSPMYDGVDVEAAMNAMLTTAQTEEVEYGTGAYLLLNPTVDGVLQLRSHLQAAGPKYLDCLDDFEDWAIPLLHNGSWKAVDEVMDSDLDIFSIEEEKAKPDPTHTLMQQQDTYFSHLIASKLASTSVLLGDEGVVKHLCEIFYSEVIARNLTAAAMFTKDNRIPADIRDAVYHAAAVSGDGCWGSSGDHSAAAWKLFSSMWELQGDPIEARRALFAIAAIPQKSVDLLMFMMGTPGSLKLKTLIPPAERPKLVAAALRSSADPELLVKMLDVVFKDVLKEAALLQEPRVWEQLAEQYVTDEAKFAVLSTAIKAKSSGPALQAISRRLLGKVKSNLQWRKTYLDQLCDIVAMG